MMDFYEHIGDYLEGKLNAEDHSLFEAALVKDDELKRAVDNHDVAIEVMGLMIEEEIRAVIDQLDNSKEAEQTEVIELSKRTNRRLYSVAATILFLFIAYMAMNLLIKGQYSHQAILDTYYIPPANPNATRSDTFEGPPIEEAMYLFDLRRFDESKALFEKVLGGQNTPEDLSTIYFYLGNIAYVNNDIKSAKEYLSQSFDKRKYYYLGQIHYLEGDIQSLEQLYNSQPSEKIKKLIQESRNWKYMWVK